ncbi:molybdate ABC transporter substrate-binding protein [Neolewinella lacunae]|uniref:Molybdate ABC transporter substrate-binding protein n=1 Tax=Neolewinella lacunae TaxID=1517758 RepID=A0A923PGG7_9BACT|nr:molybdate ABC transporter substrate-binding protein [Neolewinella lacunae]MBC6993630.1 molybdate ABC transporter substrate-binding protein [Neolewinella lacunae]MDN3635536.1 molybdate ABC transporter substrate-binding protein [Neolewinella lacunae]
MPAPFVRILGCACLALWFSCAGPSSPPPLRIAGAANLRYALEEIAAAYTQETGQPCELIYAASGKLTAQMVAGAPYDVFLSADARYPAELARQGLTHGPAQTYARGQLVLWTLSPTLSLDAAGLLDGTVQHVALANPTTAPYGAAAVAYLQRADLADTLRSKLVFGESIAQASQFVTSGAAEMGFTALSIVRELERTEPVRWVLLPADTYPALRQQVVVLRREGEVKPGAERFRDYLFTPTGRRILTEFGYLTE